VNDSYRPEEIGEVVHEHIWEEINTHLGTSAYSFPELTEQLGIMRFGRRPRVADPFCGSGQIPFEAARLGCRVYASDLNPVACMLTWGAFNIVGADEEGREEFMREQTRLVERVSEEIERLGVEADGHGWRTKVLLYCVEVRCPETGWLVPLLPTRVISKGYRVIADLVADAASKRYEIAIRTNVSERELTEAERGTIRTDGRGQDPYLIHDVDGIEHRTKISTLRGDYRRGDGSAGNRLRLWEKTDTRPRPGDVFQERLYCIQWTRPKREGRGDEYEFRSVAAEDLERERAIDAFLDEHLADWQAKGWLPDMRIEVGDKTDEPIRTRGWTHWHHLFNPRQLLFAGLVNRFSGARMKPGLSQVLNANARLSRWNQSGGGGGIVAGVFDNQALNTLFNYGCRGSSYALDIVTGKFKLFPLHNPQFVIESIPANEIAAEQDVFVSDPPYGDAVKYEEISEYFIAWLRKNPPPEFAKWVWDSRRALAVKGEGEDFRRSMVTAYRRMTECMSDNGIQVIMFTHQSGSIWADMANIVWASGLRVVAAWYVATEAEKRIQAGTSYVKGTILLVLRKRQGSHKSSRDDLAWEIQEEVDSQVAALTGLNQQAKGLYRDENVFKDADIQMAGYAAALRVLTHYAIIDGRDMTVEAIRPRVKGETTFVDGLIAFAVDTANQSLVPQGIAKSHWDKLTSAERFYLKMLDMEARGDKALDNYQNFAKAFKVRDFRSLLASHRANDARLKSAVEFGRAEMSEGSELHLSTLRAVLYALMELQNDIDGAAVLAHITLNVPNYYGDASQRDLVSELADYLAKRLEPLRPDEASAARVLRELVQNQRLG
jgi:putative DNA methylase